jgi:hypothetical protein
MESTFWGKVGISAVILGLGMFAAHTFNTTPDIAKLLLPPVQPSATAQKLLNDVSLLHSEVAVQEKGHLAQATFAINNNSNQDIKNVTILCTLLDSKGKEQGRDKWVAYDTIKAHTHGMFSHTSKMFISNKASATQCQIVDVELTQAPLIAIHRASAEGHGAAGHEDAAGATHH